MFKFEKIEGGVTLTKYSGEEVKIVVPDTYEGEPVIAIGDWAFEKCIATSIVLPDTIEVFGNSAFIACKNLLDINMPANLKIVKHNVFLGCESIVEITFPIGVEKIGPSCFVGCYALTRVFAENENVVLGKDALNGTGKLEEVSFRLIKTLDADNQTKFLLKFIEDWSNIEQYKKDVILPLVKKKSLKDALFLSGKAYIISFLFENKIKPNLETTDKYLDNYIKVGNTETIAILLDYKNKNFKKENVQALKERKELVEIGLETMSYSEFRKLWVCSKKAGGITVSGYKGDKTEETIPAEVEGIPITKLGRNSAYNYNPIQILNIEANIELIVEECFSNTGLTKINLPETLTEIGDSAFYFCSDLTEIVLPESLKTIADSAFNCCTKLKSITIPKSVTYLGDDVFELCEELTRVEILANIDTIPERTFSKCNSLEEVIISDSVKFIDYHAFADCLKLKKVTFLGDTPRFGDKAFLGTPYEKELHKFAGIFKFVVLDENSAALWKYYGEEAHVVISEKFDGNQVTFIKEDAFACTNSELIETLVLPKSLDLFKDIDSRNLKNLKKITFLNEETKLNSNSFKYLDNLEEINLFAWKFLSKEQLCNVVNKIINDWDVLSVDEQKQILSTIKKSSKNKKLLFLSEKSIVVAFLIDQKININLETLNEFLEYYNENGNALITAMLLDYKNKKFSKEVIEKSKEADELVEIGFELPTRKQLKQKWNVGNVAGGLRISGYKGTNTVETIPTGTVEGDFIVAIGSSKNDFEPIQSLVIDAKIEVLSEKTFSGCRTLSTIRLPDTLKSIEYQAFYACSDLVDIIIPDGVETINGYAFQGCSSLETIIIPDSVTSLKIACFSYCDKLKNISLPATITNIPHWGFQRCINLEEIVIPNSVEVINHYAFQNCISLTKITFPESLRFVEKFAFCSCQNLKKIELKSPVVFGEDVFKDTSLEEGV